MLTLSELIELDARLAAGALVVGPAEPRDIPELVRLLNTRRMAVRLPLKFPRTEKLLAESWRHVRWLAAWRGGDLVGCLELRPVPGEPEVWEMGSFSQAAGNRNPRVPVRLMAAGFRTLLALGARAAVVEVHRQNAPMWGFLRRLPFVPEGPSPSHSEFIRCRMTLRAEVAGVR